MMMDTTTRLITSRMSIIENEVEKNESNIINIYDLLIYDLRLIT